MKSNVMQYLSLETMCLIFKTTVLEHGYELFFINWNKHNSVGSPLEVEYCLTKTAHDNHENTTKIGCVAKCSEAQKNFCAFLHVRLHGTAKAKKILHIFASTYLTDYLLGDINEIIVRHDLRTTFFRWW